MLLVISAPQLVKHGRLDYLVSDYLSEITMSLLTAAKSRRAVSGQEACACAAITASLCVQDMGYTPDFVQSLGPLLTQVKEKGIKVVSNAGGINPLACVQALQGAAKQAGVNISVAMVTGDDLLYKVCIQTYYEMKCKTLCRWPRWLLWERWTLETLYPTGSSPVWMLTWGKTCLHIHTHACTYFLQSLSHCWGIAARGRYCGHWKMCWLRPSSGSSYSWSNGINLLLINHYVSACLVWLEEYWL